MNIPFDSKPSNSRLLCENVSSYAVEIWFRWRVGVELFGVVLIVDVVSYSDEFSIIVGTSEEDDGDAKDLRIGNTFGVWGIGLENELVYTDRYRANEKGVEFLIMLITK